MKTVELMINLIGRQQTINVREYQRGNQKGQSRETTTYGSQDEDKQNKNTI